MICEESLCVRSEQLQDFVAFEYILLGDLRDLLEERFDEETRKWMIAVLDALLETFPEKLRIQERDGGYMADVLDSQPNWDSLVNQLRAEYDELFATLKILRDEIEFSDTDSRTANEARLRLRDWMRSQRAHHQHETRLVQTALTFEGTCLSGGCSSHRMLCRLVFGHHGWSS